MTMRALVLAVLSTIAVSGCENMQSIHHIDHLKDVDVILVDAKQRGILNAPADDRLSRFNNPKRFVCVEPSPDVAQAVSAAMSAALKFDAQQPSAGSTSVGGQLSHSVSASIAQLGERLAVIQLVREKMYRACEAFQNGMLTTTGYTLMMARLDKTLSALLSSEMAAGAFGRQLASAGGGNSSAFAKAIADQKAVVQEKAKAAAAAADEAARKTAIEELLREDATLIRLQMAADMGAVQGNVGVIAGARGNLEVGAISRIHQRYVDDDGLEPLLDACISSLDFSGGSTIERKANDADPLSANLLKDEAAKMFAKEGNNLAAVCMERVISKDFVVERMKNKLELRKMEMGTAKEVATLKAVEFCIGLETPNSSIPKEARANYRTACAGILASVGSDK